MKSKGILIFSAVVIASFCVLGIFAWPFPADEYAFYNLIARNGWLQSQISYYLNWTGRVFNTFLVFSCTSFRLEKIQPFMPFITVITYLMAVFSLLGSLFPLMKRVEKLSLSFLLTAMTLCLSFSLHETFYWMPGMPYFWSTTLIVYALSLALRAFRGSRAAFWGCVAVLFLNGTMLEQPCVYQGVVAFVAMVYFLWRGDRKRGFMAGAFWLASIAAFCVMYFAPGTAARLLGENKGSLPPLMTRLLNGFMIAFSAGVLNAFQFLVKPMLYSVIFFLPEIARRISPVDERLSRRLRAWHIVALMFIISMFMQFMMGVIAGSGLAGRGTSLSMWLMAFTWTLLWVFFYRGKLVHSEGFANFCAKMRWPVLILAILVSANFRECVSDLRIAPEYAREWDSRVEAIISQREMGEKTLRVTPLKAKPELIFADIALTTDWARHAFAGYYGADEIFLVPEELSGNLEDVRKIMSADFTPYAKLAESGDIDAIKIMASYRNPRTQGGRKEDKNIDETLKWYMLGAAAGDAVCMKSMPRFLLKTDFVSAVCWQVRAYALLARL